MCCGLWLSTVAGMTLVWWLINHDLVKGEADQAKGGVRKKRKKWWKKRKEGSGGDHNEWLPTVTSSSYRLKLSVLPGRLNTF